VTGRQQPRPNPRGRTIMAYDRYDPRDRSRDEQSRWPDDRNSDRNRSMSGDWRGARHNSDDRGFFDRASDEVASWFGDDEAERRRREDRMRDEGASGRGWDRERQSASDRDRQPDWNGDRSAGPGRHRDWNDNRGAFALGGST